MYIATTKPLFAWECLEDNPGLATIKKFIAAVSDGKLLIGLRQHRGRGRNDCPVHVAWGRSGWTEMPASSALSAMSAEAA